MSPHPSVDLPSLLALAVLGALGLTAIMHGMDHESDLLVTTIASGIVGWMARGARSTTAAAPDGTVTSEVKP